MTTQDDLNAQASYSIKDVDAHAGAVASVTASVQTAKEVADEFKKYSSYAPKRFPKSVDEGASWAKSSLEKYAKDNGKQWAHDEIENVASAYGYEGFVPDKIPTNEKECAEALVNIGCSAAAAELGVDPKLAKVTVEAVLDGKLDKEDCESIGKTAGAVAGAAICQMYGIPAPIGAFLGGELGGWVGGEVADIFGFSSRAHEKWLKEQKKIVAEILAKAEDQCATIRSGFWTSFDAYILQAERQWENLELKVGTKFELRWFGRSRGPNFTQYLAQQASRYPAGYLSAAHCETVCEDGTLMHQGSSGPYLQTLSQSAFMALSAQCRRDFIANPHMNTLQRAALKIDPKLPDPKLSDVCGQDCLVDSFGCLYPDLTPAIKYYPTGYDVLGSTKRVVAGYRALGFDWLPPVTPALFQQWGVRRTGNDSADYAALMAALKAHEFEYRRTWCDMPAATSRAVKDTKYRKLWVDWLDTLLGLEVQRVSQLNSVSVRLFGDLAQTAAAIAVQNKFKDARTIAALKGLSGTDAVLTTRDKWINNAALAGGLGVLAYSFKGASR